MTDRAREEGGAQRRELSTVDGLAQLSFLVYGTLERLVAEYDASIVQTRLLGVLRDRRPTMQELARLLALEKSSVTGLVDRAERRGLVIRVSSCTDRRAVLVELTEQGRSLVGRVASRFERDVAEMLDSLSERERATLSGLVSRVLVAHAREHGIDLLTAGEGAI
jgi:MarR family transcriptional regulator, lower aerobic nicotinate degradation pathway regulator